MRVSIRRTSGIKVCDAKYLINPCLVTLPQLYNYIHFKRLSLIVRVNVVLNRTVVVYSD